jgi:dynein light chain LC8-type
MMLTRALASYPLCMCGTRVVACAPSSGLKKELHNVMAKYIKKDFDATYGGVWHCVVGRNFGSFVVHQSRTFVYFYLGQIAVLLFKSGSQAL